MSAARHSDYIRFLFTWKEFEKSCIPALQKLLKRRHPAMAGCDKSFNVYIHKHCERTCYQIFENIWMLIVHNRQGKSPDDFPKLRFHDLKDYMKTFLPPVAVTEEHFKDEHFFNRMTEEEKQAFVKEHNDDTYRGWKYVEDYTLEFIRVMQDLLLPLIPDLIDIEAGWWMVYEYRFRMEFFRFRFWSGRMEHAIKCGLTGDWLDKPPKELDNKMRETRHSVHKA